VDVNLNSASVTHNEQAHRFELDIDGLCSILIYRWYPDRIIFDHIEVL